jgi:hypothetical protein
MDRRTQVGALTQALHNRHLTLKSVRSFRPQSLLGAYPYGAANRYES